MVPTSKHPIACPFTVILSLSPCPGQVQRTGAAVFGMLGADGAIAPSFAKDQVSPKQGMTTPALYDYENFYRTHGTDRCTGRGASACAWLAGGCRDAWRVLQRCEGCCPWLQAMAAVATPAARRGGLVS